MVVEPLTPLAVAVQVLGMVVALIGPARMLRWATVAVLVTDVSGPTRLVTARTSAVSTAGTEIEASVLELVPGPVWLTAGTGPTLMSRARTCRPKADPLTTSALVVAVALLSAGFGSRSLALTVAVFTIVTFAVAVTRVVTV